MILTMGLPQGDSIIPITCFPQNHMFLQENHADSREEEEPKKIR